jgi:integrase
LRLPSLRPMQQTGRSGAKHRGGATIWPPCSPVLIAATGLRKGEALALRWDRVDLDAGTLKVAATIARVNHALTITEPKTARSRRTVPLSPAVVAMLRKHRATQKAERLRAGNQWREGQRAEELLGRWFATLQSGAYLLRCVADRYPSLLGLA